MSMNESNNNNNNNNPASGRPPPPPPPPSAHRRAPSSMPAQGMPSLGEQAANANANNAPLLSPIVPPQEEGSQSNETRHNRKVSWGGVTSPTLNLTPSGVASALASIIPQQQTQQQASEVSNNAAASNPTSSFLDRLQKSQAPSTRRFNLNEMLGSGPVEQEAETCILRAVEKISGQRHQRTPTEMASLFSEIAADDIVRSMQQQQQNEEHSDSEDEDDFFEDAPALGSTEPKSSSFSSFGGEGAVRTGEYLAQIGSQEAIEVAAPTYCNLESIPSYGSNGTDNTASASSHEYPLLQTVASNKSVGRSTRSVVGGPAAAARSMRNLGGTAKSTRSLGNTEKSSRFLGTGAKSKLQSAVRKQMAANTVEQTLLGLTSTLNNMKEEEVRKKEHRRQATQINMTENEKLTETADALAGHLCNSADQNGAGNNTSSPSRVASDVEAPINSTKSNATAVDDIGDTDDSTHDGSSVHLSNGDPSLASGKNKKRKKHKHVISNNIKEDFQLLQDFLSNRKWQMQLYIQRVFLFIMIPSIAVAALLFYFVENPTLCQEEVERQVGSNGTDDEEGDSEVISFVCPDTGAASASWLILFIGVRQVITLTMALITQAIIVDYLCLNCRFSLRFLGPFITLFFVQARGWPFVAVFWAIYDLVLLAGDNDYTRHWGYWQEWVELFNANNPSGRVIEHELNYQILKLAIIVGIVVSIKRLFVSLYLGRATFAHFGEELAKVMKSMIIVGEVATLSKDIEYYAEQDQLDNMSVYHDNSSIAGGWNDKDIQQLVSKEADAERRAQAFKDSQVGSNAATAAKRFMANRATQAKTKPAPNVPNNGPPSFCSPTPSMGGASSTVVNEDFSASEKSKLSDLLEAWEEPQTAEQKEEKKITLGAVLQFRQALTFMQKRHPFLPAFGPADTVSGNRCILAERPRRYYPAFVSLSR